MKKYNAFSLLFWLLFSLPNLADEALYGPAPPADAAFFRVLNLSDDIVALKVGSEINADVGSYSVSGYGYISASKFRLELDGVLVMDAAKSGQIFTLVYSGSGQKTEIIEDQSFDNKRMALVRLYNFSHEQAIELKTLNGKTSIIGEVGFTRSKERVIRAVKLPVAVFQGNDMLIDSEPLLLQKNQVTSLFSVKSPNGLSLIIGATAR